MPFRECLKKWREEWGFSSHMRAADPETEGIVEEGSVSLPSREKAYRLRTYPAEEGSPGGAHLWVENKRDAGEDAWPLVTYAPGLRVGLLGAADGMGANGSRKFVVNGREISGARIAADLAIDVLHGTFRHFVSTKTGLAGVDPDLFHRHLETALDRAFQAKPTELERGPRWDEVQGKYLRLLPTTLGCVLYEVLAEGVNAHVLWAGDTRCYAWDVTGLRQLSADDSQAPEGKAPGLHDGGALTNYLSEVSPARLNLSSYCFPKPLLLLVGSDGVHDCFRTPMHLEYALVDAGRRAGSEREFTKLLSERVGALAGDDVSAAIAWIGWDTWEALQAAMRVRERALWQDYIYPLWHTEDAIVKAAREIDHINRLRQETQQRLSTLKTERTAAEQRLWNKFRPGYEAFRADQTRGRKNQ